VRIARLRNAEAQWVIKLINDLVADGRGELDEIKRKSKELLEDNLVTSAKARKNLQAITGKRGLSL